MSFNVLQHTKSKRMEMRYDPWKAHHRVKMPEKFELERYLSISVQELFDILRGSTTVQIFRALAALSLRNLADPNFHSAENQQVLKQIAMEGITFKNRKLAYNLFCQLYPDQLGQISLGESKSLVTFTSCSRRNMAV